jgi:hypothetical protein
MNYLYFSEATVDGGGEGGDMDNACFPVSSILGVAPNSDTTSKIFFESLNGTGAGPAGENDTITVAHASGKHREFAELVASVSETRTGRDRSACPQFIVFADEKAGIYYDNGNGAGVNGAVVTSADAT